MGLNLDVTHVAFAGLSKFDGSRRRRLSFAEMAQIAGRAGRHQRDGSFGTLAGESSEFTPEEIAAIENHDFPRLDWLYWRESRPRTNSVAMLIADLESKPDHKALRAAPEAIDLDVLKRLSENTEAMALVRSPRQVARLWETASLPDFRQMGAEYHARFVASLWQHLGSGDGFLPYPFVAAEIARLDTIQGDVATLSARIAAVRTWTYIAHRKDWLADPPAMSERTRGLEEKLSDALHAALKQRFVDKRTTMLLRKGAGDIGLLPVIVDDNNSVTVDGEHIGTLNGFAFHVDPLAKAGDRKLLLAAAERHLAALLKQKARNVGMAQDSEFALGTDMDRRPVVLWNDTVLGSLAKGRTLMQPVFRASKAVAGLEGDDLRAVTDRAESWIAAQIEKHLGGVAGLGTLAQDPATDGNVRALAIQLAEAGGIAGRMYLADALAALPKEARGAARKGGIVFGALDVYHHAALKPAAVRWRVALFAARDDKPVAELPPESAVHLKEWNFANPADCRNAGYRRIGDEYLRIDLAERVIKKAHEARGQALQFGMDMAFATSLGVSDAGLAVLMRDAGFRPVNGPSDKSTEPCHSREGGERSDREVNPSPDISDTQDDNKEPDAQAMDSRLLANEEAPEEHVVVERGFVSEPVPEETPPAIPEPILTHWRWVGIRKPKLVEHRKPNRSVKKESSDRPQSKRPERAEKPIAQSSQPSALALQLAALNLSKTR
jgi:ATP-dependent RNA helicase SUPV3L1/SUV3